MPRKGKSAVAICKRTSTIHCIHFWCQCLIRGRAARYFHHSRCHLGAIARVLGFVPIIHPAKPGCEARTDICVRANHRWVEMMPIVRRKRVPTTFLEAWIRLRRLARCAICCTLHIAPIAVLAVLVSELPSFWQRVWPTGNLIGA